MNFRFRFALLLGKLLGFLLQKLTGRGSNAPGVVMQKLCPNALAFFTLPELTICVTGTNGKTGTANMVTSLLRAGGKTVTNNSEGSNMAPGLITALMRDSDVKGRVKTDAAVLEVDERSSPYIYTKFTPDYILCTNLFRDSIKRNGHSEYIFHKMDDYLPESTKLLLNGNDAISGLLGQGRNEQIFFAVDATSEATENCENTTCDLMLCPNCGEVLHYDFYHYHHIGQPHCSCGFQMPMPRFRATAVDAEAGNFLFVEEGEPDLLLPFSNGNLFQVFNVTAAAAICRLVGMQGSEIAKAMTAVTTAKTRFSSEEIGGHPVYSMLCKNQNPVSSTQSIAFVNRVEGTKDVVLLITDSKERVHGHEDISWLYDTDFDALKSEAVQHVFLGGVRCEDLALRLTLGGIDPQKLLLYPDYDELCAALPGMLEEKSSVILYYELYAMDEAAKVKKALRGMKL